MCDFKESFTQKGKLDENVHTSQDVAELFLYQMLTDGLIYIWDDLRAKVFSGNFHLNLFFQCKNLCSHFETHANVLWVFLQILVM